MSCPLNPADAAKEKKMEPERIPWPVRSIKQSWIDDRILNLLNLG